MSVPAAPLLSVEGLEVTFGTDAPAVCGVDLAVGAVKPSPWWVSPGRANPRRPRRFLGCFRLVDGSPLDALCSTGATSPGPMPSGYGR